MKNNFWRALSTAGSLLMILGIYIIATGHELSLNQAGRIERPRWAGGVELAVGVVLFVYGEYMRYRKQKKDDA